ncbi:MAG TPA: hypothetical protein VI953_04815, partial [Candidatus Paceibacterota bacterium]
MSEAGTHERNERHLESLTLPPDLARLEVAGEYVAKILEDYAWDEEHIESMKLAFGEILSNAYFYGSGGLVGGKGESKIALGDKLDKK